MLIDSCAAHDLMMMWWYNDLALALYRLRFGQYSTEIATNNLLEPEAVLRKDYVAANSVDYDIQAAIGSAR